MHHLLAEKLVVLRIQRNIVLVYVLVQALSAQHFGDLDQLVIIVVPVEEWFLPENLKGEMRIDHMDRN